IDSFLLFELCDQGFSSNFYYDACIIDGCVNQDIKKACTSLQMYAAECMSRKQLCIDWRNYTGGQCSLKCPSNKIYKTCESSKEQTCTPSNENVLQPEGCFCPGNTINFSPGSDICVDKWEGCMGPDGVHRKFGESFEFKCQDCICDNITQQVICQPHKCDSSPSVTCDGDGFIVAKVPNPKDHCCMETECKCIISLCNSTEIKCDLGFNIVTKTPDGKCCPVSTCGKLKKHFVFPNWLSPDIPLSKCQRCTCTNETNPETQLNKISCQNVECNKKCEQGFEYQEMTDECCGKCVQVKCLVDLGDQPVVLLPPGDELPSPYNNCTVFGCTQIHDFLLLNVSKIICPDFDEDNCEPVSIITENGCCKTCDFVVSFASKSILCFTFQPFMSPLTINRYSTEANSMDHKCTCCQETMTHEKEILLLCPDGTTIQHRYIYVDECNCVKMNCEEITNTTSQRVRSCNTSYFHNMFCVLPKK
uniref:CTCK domain-containing protein n=1 Tax=Callorhinchus milii TaxID=7868 RepID=A0A4W3H2P2_CALMI